jgi:hypothetical protein
MNHQLGNYDIMHKSKEKSLTYSIPPIFEFQLHKLNLAFYQNVRKKERNIKANLQYSSSVTTKRI